MHITPSEAIERIVSKSGQRRSKALSAPRCVREIGKAVYLVQYQKKGVIAPADDALDAVIGECDKVDFTLAMPPCFEEWMEGYAREVEWYQNVGSRLPVTDAVMVDDVSDTIMADVAPLLKTKWNQIAPWNKNLVFDGEKSLVGCVPLSMGQILYYWAMKGYRRGCMASEGYVTRTNKYKVGAMPAVTVFDFDNMITGKPTKAVNKNAVAEMLEHIGKSIQADYKPSATGAYTEVAAKKMQSSFRLGSGIRIIKASSLGLAAFSEQVRKELELQRPVMMAGGNSARTYAHSFVCDGYRAKDGKFHFNWGWGGSANGYFAMGALKPYTDRDYSYYKSAVIGIEPEYKLGDVNGDGVSDISDVLRIVDDANKVIFEESADINSDGEINKDDAELVVNHILGKEKL